MIPRRLHHQVEAALAETPAVALLGPRQVGKTTLALQIASSRPSIYLDLESERDRSKLDEAELYLSDHLDRLVVLDEVHRAPGMFPILRGMIDQARRQGQGNGRYLLLGSANLDLLKQSGESLAGRVSYLELGPLDLLEIDQDQQDLLWVRGGFPGSLLADSAPASLRWRDDFIRTYLERDIPQFGPRIAAQTLRRFWTMLAHHQGGLLNAAQFARNLGVDGRTVASYLDLLTDLLLVRQLPPWHENLGKRLVKSSKVYLRDSGLLHALLGIGDKDSLFGHPVVGHSWEGFVIDNLLAQSAGKAQAHFYRTSAGAEIDLLLTWPNDESWAIEVKRSLSPKLEKGFHQACVDLQPDRRYVVYPGQERYRLAETIEAIPLRLLAREVVARATA